MLQLIVGTVLYALVNAIIKTEEVTMDKAWKECEETDWNEYYAKVN